MPINHTMITRCIYIILCSATIYSSAFAQRTIQPKNPANTLKGFIYNTEWAIEPRLNTDGYGIGFLVGTIKKYNVTKFKKIEIGQRKHPHETRQPTIPNGTRQSNIVYGRINYFFPIRATIGTKRYLSEKAKRKGIALGYSYEIGPTLGILKPYFLEIARLDAAGENEIITQERYSEENADDFLDLNKIRGSAGLFSSWDGFNIKPGISAKAGVHFAWGAYDAHVTALEIGVMVDVYLGDIDLVATDDNQPYYIGFYLSGQFGRRK